MRIVDITREDEALLDAFYEGIYLADFAPQREPLEAWKRALWGGAAYEMHVRLALEGETILGGIAYELYPQSRCGLVTYMVVGPAARGRGLGRTLQTDAARSLFASGARAVFGEVNDPRVPHAYESVEQSWTRLERNQRWGARVLLTPYIQPSLGPGLSRDHGLLLIALAGDAPLPASLPGALVRDFIAELFAANEGGPPDAELRSLLDRTPDVIPLLRIPSESDQKI